MLLKIEIPLIQFYLKVLSYWNLNGIIPPIFTSYFELKVLSYWNLNLSSTIGMKLDGYLKYYHIGI